MKKHIISTAIQLANESGLINLSRAELCKHTGISEGSFTYYMNCTFTQFIDSIKNDVIENKNHIVKKNRANPSLRKEQLLAVAINLATKKGYSKLKRDEVADAAGVSLGLITKHFPTMNQLRRDIMRCAVKLEIPEIVAQGLINKDKHALKASEKLKKLAAESILK